MLTCKYLPRILFEFKTGGAGLWACGKWFIKITTQRDRLDNQTGSCIEPLATAEVFDSLHVFQQQDLLNVEFYVQLNV